MTTNQSQKSIVIFAGLLLTNLITLNAQDLIHTKNGSTIAAKVERIDTQEVTYKRHDNPDGPVIVVDKSTLKKITFENGTEQVFGDTETSEPVSIEETKSYIVETIKNHGFDRDAFKWKYHAKFEGNLLRLTHYKKNSDTKLKDEGKLYDFSNVYRFQRVSERADDLAFLNIYVSVCQNEKRGKWDKEKLVMRMDDPVIARSLLKALKHYNKLLLENEKTERKDLKF